MEIKALWEDAKEAVMQKVEWVKENPKDAIKMVGKIVWNVGFPVVVGWGAKKVSQLQQDNNILLIDNETLRCANEVLTNENSQLKGVNKFINDKNDYLTAQLKRAASDGLRNGSSECGKTMYRFREAK